MKFLKILLVSIVALSSMSAPVLAQSTSSGPLERIGSVAAETSDDTSNFEGGSDILVAVLAAAAMVIGIVIIADDDEPASP